MKRSDIEPHGVYGKVSYRDSRHYWPVMILSTDSYQLHYHTRELTHAGTARLVQGDYRRSAVGLLAVTLAFSLNEGGDVLEFRAKAELLSSLVNIDKARDAIEARAKDGFGTDAGARAVEVRDAEGNVLGHYELLTGLQMVRGPYVDLVLAERRAEAQRTAYASELEQERVAALARHTGIAGRLRYLGVMITRASDYEHPSSVRLSFEQAERLLDLAESAVRANRAADIGTPEPRPFSSEYDRLYAEYLGAGAPGSWDDWLKARTP